MQGRLAIGVCDGASRCAWGLQLATGRLHRVSRDACGSYDICAPAPEGYPDDGTCSPSFAVFPGTKVAFCHEDDAQGGLVEVLVDHDAGVLGYRINGGMPFVAIRGFRRGAALRPWAQLNWEEECVQLTGPLQLDGPPSATWSDAEVQLGSDPM